MRRAHLGLGGFTIPCFLRFIGFPSLWKINSLVPRRIYNAWLDK